jgi:hypothetical protein
MLVFFKLDPIPLLLDSPFGNRYLQSDLLTPHISVRGIGGLILPTRDTAIFGGGSVDYGLKSTRGSRWVSYKDGRFELRSH